MNMAYDLQNMLDTLTLSAIIFNSSMTSYNRVKIYIKYRLASTIRALNWRDLKSILKQNGAQF